MLGEDFLVILQTIVAH